MKRESGRKKGRKIQRGSKRTVFREREKKKRSTQIDIRLMKSCIEWVMTFIQIFYLIGEGKEREKREKDIETSALETFYLYKLVKMMKTFQSCYPNL